ncbi:MULTISPECIES: hypothetical protein [Cupriavidus]
MSNSNFDGEYNKNVHYTTKTCEDEYNLKLYPPGMSTIGQRIRSALMRLDKTPKWLSSQVGVSYETVRKWLSDESAPKRGRVTAVAVALGLSEETLMFGSGATPPTQAGEPVIAPAPQESAQAWPFSVPRAEFDKLSPEDRANLDAVVSKFIAGCLAEQPLFARKKKVLTFTGLHPESNDQHKAR